MKRQILADALATLAGIHGVEEAFAFRDDGGVAALPPATRLTGESASAAAAVLARLAAELAGLRAVRAAALDLVYGDLRLVVLPLPDGGVALLCSPGTNPALLRARARVALRAVESELASPPGGVRR